MLQGAHHKESWWAYFHVLTSSIMLSLLHSKARESFLYINHYKGGDFLGRIQNRKEQKLYRNEHNYHRVIVEAHNVFVQKSIFMFSSGAGGSACSASEHDGATLLQLFFRYDIMVQIHEIWKDGMP